MNAREPQPYAHAKWEYLIESSYLLMVPVDDEYLGELRVPPPWSTRVEAWEAKMCALGREGWELVWMRDDERGFIGCFKRPA